MAITSGTRVVQGKRSITEVTVTYEFPPDRAISWEFHCAACDELLVGLTPSMATEELATHVCAPNDDRG